MKEIYLDIMEKSLAAYSDEAVDAYIASVAHKGLREHGFPRLAANVGILIAHRRELHMLPRFRQMMTLCCDQMPGKRGVANDFSVKEICFALMELERTDVIEKAELDAWKGKIRALPFYESYDVIASDPNKHYANWAGFVAASEFLRMYCLGVDTAEYVDMQLASQVVSFNQNGLYKDPNHPILYDFVGRLEMSAPLFFGYNGKYASIIDENLQKAGDISLKYQSVSGELPFGGRSSAFLYNEAVMAAIYEFEARRYAKLGDREKAGQFKAAAILSAKSLLGQLDEFPGHIKNHYDPNAGMGCEKYAYFLKYMITVASYAFNAYLYADDGILPTVCPAERGGYLLETDADFHKIIACFAGYYLEFETNADFHYDANGLGRIHRKGVPSQLCLSSSFVTEPNYKSEIQNSYDASICCCAEENGVMLTGAQAGTAYQKISEAISETALEFVLRCSLVNGATVDEAYRITENGVDLELRHGGAGILFPVFMFDGKTATVIETAESCVTVRYQGHVCRYTFDGGLEQTGDIMFNRNGRYEIFKMTGKRLHIEME